jgi:hypothetical protein
MTTIHRYAPRLLFGVFVLAAAGCGSSHHLKKYDFAGGSAAVIAAIPPAPTVFSDLGLGYLDLDRPLEAFLRVGTAVVKEGEVQVAQKRLDEALARVDVAERLAEQTLLRGARHLRYHPINDPDQADYLIDLRVADYGLVADSWESTVFFMIDAEVVLIDNATGRVIWDQRVREREPASRRLIGLGPTAGNVITAATLSKLSSEEMVEAFERLADYSADHLVASLRHDYFKSRRK